MEMHEPYTFLNGLTVADMEDLLEDIQVPPGPITHTLASPRPCFHPTPLCLRLQVYMELEQGKNVDFWRDMTIITEDEISKLRKLEASGKGPGNPGPALTPSRLTRKITDVLWGTYPHWWGLSWGHICIGGGCHWG